MPPAVPAVRTRARAPSIAPAKVIPAPVGPPPEVVPAVAFAPRVLAPVTPTVPPEVSNEALRVAAAVELCGPGVRTDWSLMELPEALRLAGGGVAPAAPFRAVAPAGPA